MKNFKAIAFLFLSIMFGNCFGMTQQLSDLIKNRINMLQELDAKGGLSAPVFWRLIDVCTEHGTNFQGIAWRHITNDEAIYLLQKLIEFGQKDKNTFFICMHNSRSKPFPYSGTAITEIISKIDVPQTQLFDLFKELLQLINTLDQDKKNDLLTQELIQEAKSQHKQFIVEEIGKTLQQ